MAQQLKYFAVFKEIAASEYLNPAAIGSAFPAKYDHSSTLSVFRTREDAVSALFCNRDFADKVPPLFEVTLIKNTRKKWSWVRALLNNVQRCELTMNKIEKIHAVHIPATLKNAAVILNSKGLKANDPNQIFYPDLNERLKGTAPPPLSHLAKEAMFYITQTVKQNLKGCLQKPSYYPFTAALLSMLPLLLFGRALIIYGVIAGVSTYAGISLRNQWYQKVAKRHSHHFDEKPRTLAYKNGKHAVESWPIYWRNLLCFKNWQNSQDYILGYLEGQGEQSYTQVRQEKAVNSRARKRLEF